MAFFCLNKVFIAFKSLLDVLIDLKDVIRATLVNFASINFRKLYKYYKKSYNNSIKY